MKRKIVWLIQNVETQEVGDRLCVGIMKNHMSQNAGFIQKEELGQIDATGKYFY